MAPSRLWSLACAALLLLLLVTGCGAPTPRRAVPPKASTTARSANTTVASTRPAPVTAPAGETLVAEPSGSTVELYPSPAGGHPLMTLPNPWLLNGVSDQPIPQALLVLSTRSDGWTEVQLPTRPNASTAWLAPRSAQLLADPYRIDVSLHLHRITVLDAGAEMYRGPVATGAPATPTPTGLFYIRVLLRTTDPTSVYGPYAYGLSAHSEALTTFDGGDAEIGVHGNDDASVLGHSVTHGCVRMDNTEITLLSHILPLGTPVEIDP